MSLTTEPQQTPKAMDEYAFSRISAARAELLRALDEALDDDWRNRVHEALEILLEPVNTKDSS